MSVADVRRGELCWAAWKNGKAEISPVTHKAEQAENLIEALKPDEVVRDQSISTVILAWLAQHETPQSAPALPLYSRGPDAKLPGGISPPTAA